MNAKRAVALWLTGVMFVGCGITAYKIKTISEEFKEIQKINKSNRAQLSRGAGKMISKNHPIWEAPETQAMFLRPIPSTMKDWEAIEAGTWWGKWSGPPWEMKSIGPERKKR